MKKIKATKTSSFGTSGRINHNSEKFYNSKMYNELAQKEVIMLEKGEIAQKYVNQVILGSSENMKEIPDNSLHLMITSPPYNVSKEYDEDLSLTEYLTFLKNVFQETYRVLVNGGRACINVANLGRKPYIPLSDYISQIMIGIGFNMRGEIIWNKAAGAGTSTAWGSWQSASNPTLRDVHEYILVFSKGDYNRPKEGKDTITKEQFIEWTKSIWTFSPVSAKKVGHPAPFPEELPYRLIQLYSFENDIILDPFMGSGTTALSALKTSRNYIGYEISEEYLKLANQKLDAVKSQTKLDI